MAEGFSAMGLCAPDAIPEAAGRLAAFVAQGHHGQMGWMEERMAWRGNPAALWPQAKTVIMLAEVYSADRKPTPPDRGEISIYAQGKDYHDLVKRRLKRLGGWLVRQEPCEIKVFVDTAPVMEKPLAQAAGLGWQGKHTNLLSRDLGNWFFLGAIFTTLDLPKDAPEVSHCGSCTACLDACPTQAFPAPYQLDARRCISYLTIEHKGPVDPALREGLGNRIYGCDLCLAACPWNKFAQQSREAAFTPRAELQAPLLSELATLDDATFRTRFSGTAVKRIGRDRFLRNVAYALGNSGTPSESLPAVERLLQDDSPLVRGAAVWALSQLAPDEVARRGQTAEDSDAGVRVEWAEALRQGVKQ